MNTLLTVISFGLCASSIIGASTLPPSDGLQKKDAPSCGNVLWPRGIPGDGKSPDLGEFPWLALLEYKTNKTQGNATEGEEVSEREILCGGVLISDRHVLTAAHCLRPTLELIGVRLGEHDTATDQDCLSDGEQKWCSEDVVVVGIEKVTPHESYKFERELSDDDPTQPNSTEANSTEANSTEANSTEANSTEANSTEANSTEANLPSANSTEPNLPPVNSTEVNLPPVNSTELNPPQVNLTQLNSTEPDVAPLYDIGIIRLDRSIYTKYIQPICLPSAEVAKQKKYLSAGWGAVPESTHSMTNLKLMTRAIKMEKEACNEKYGNQLQADVMCAYTKTNLTVCTGDSGGPLMTPDRTSKMMVVGIFAPRGDDFCQKDLPGTYIDVFQYLDWINIHIQD